MKKDLSTLTTDLSSLAEGIPTQNVRTRGEETQPEAPKVTPSKPKRKTKPADEPIIQFSFGLRKSLRKELARLSSDSDMTMRSFILAALKEKGLKVTDDDLADKRKRAE